MTAINKRPCARGLCIVLASIAFNAACGTDDAAITETAPGHTVSAQSSDVGDDQYCSAWDELISGQPAGAFEDTATQLKVYNDYADAAEAVAELAPADEVPLLLQVAAASRGYAIDPDSREATQLMGELFKPLINAAARAENDCGIDFIEREMQEG